MNEQFIESFKEIQDQVHQVAKLKGWWAEPRNDGELIALMHSELSEALEALRNRDGRSAIESEFADVIIRIMDFAEARHYDVASAIIRKNEFNKTREHKHGGKEF